MTIRALLIALGVTWAGIGAINFATLPAAPSKGEMMFLIFGTLIPGLVEAVALALF
jgi:hypothetical protein